MQEQRAGCAGGERPRRSARLSLAARPRGEDNQVEN